MPYFGTLKQMLEDELKMTDKERLDNGPHHSLDVKRTAFEDSIPEKAETSARSQLSRNKAEAKREMRDLEDNINSLTSKIKSHRKLAEKIYFNLTGIEGGLGDIKNRFNTLIKNAHESVDDVDSLHEAREELSISLKESLQSLNEGKGLQEVNFKLLADRMEYNNKINELLCKIDLHSKKLLAAEQQREALKLNDAISQEILDCLKARSKDEGNGEASTVFSYSRIENLYGPKRILKVSACGECNELGISKHGIVALANDHRVIIYSDIVQIEEVLCKWNDDEWLHCLAWNEDGTLLAVGGWKPSTFTIDIWDVSKKSMIKQLKYEDNQDCYSIVWKGNIVSFATMSFIYHWDIYSQDDSQGSNDKMYQIPIPVNLCHHNDRINTMQWSPCKSKLALMTWKGHMYIYDENMNLIHDIQAHSEIKSVLQWCPWDNQVVATGCDHGFLKLWRLENTASIIKEVKIDSGIPNLIWIPLKNAIASSCYNNQLILWEYPSLSRITVLNTHTSTPRNLALTRDKNLVSRSSEEMIFWKPFD